MAIHISIDAQALAGFLWRHPILELALFGSVLQDDFSPQSDVDVLVEFEPGHMPGFAFVEMLEELASSVSRRVDLSTPGLLSPYIRDRIVREARILYGAD